MVIIDLSTLDQLFKAIEREGYSLIGPTLRDGAIVYDRIHSTADLPAGWTDEQSPGHYRLRRRRDNALFGYAVGPQGWKRWLFPPRERLIQLGRPQSNGQTAPEMRVEPLAREKLAFIGVRSCELQAIALQDRAFTQGPYVDRRYLARRRNAFIVAVNCGQAAGTCFCTSMGTGPRATAGFDLVLTELLEDDRHELAVECGSERGEALLGAIEHRPAGPADREAVDRAIDRARDQVIRGLDTAGLKETLQRNLEHPRWQKIAERCLSCGNCTMVCPTCFCSTVQDVTDLSGERAERWREWDSCFNPDFSYIVGGSIRATPASRYRQWLTHKLANWHDQFGAAGCVGCGRCITWCPVGIDITEEAAAFRETDQTALAGKEHE